MRPWEETWFLEGAGRELEIRSVDRDLVCKLEEARKAAYQDVERAKLVAAAPDMARELLAIEWSARSADSDPLAACPRCGGLEPGQTAVEIHPSEIGHGAWCPMNSTLEKAGVR